MDGGKGAASAFKSEGVKPVDVIYSQGGTCACFACHLDSNFIKAHGKQMFATCGKGLMPQLVEVVANETNRSTCKQGYQKFRHP